MVGQMVIAEKLALSKKPLKVTELQMRSNSFDEVGLDRYIQQCYELTEPFEVEDFGGHGVSRLYQVSKEIDKEIDPRFIACCDKALEAGWIGEYYFEYFLNGMCRAGYLKAGLYLITDKW